MFVNNKLAKDKFTVTNTGALGFKEYHINASLVIKPETPPPVPEFPLGSAMPIAIIPLWLCLWWKRKQKTPQ